MKAGMRRIEIKHWRLNGGRYSEALQAGKLLRFKLPTPPKSIVGGNHFVDLATDRASLGRKGCAESSGGRPPPETLQRVREYLNGNSDLDLACVASHNEVKQRGENIDHLSSQQDRLS